MTGIRLPDPMNGRFGASSDKNRPGYGKINDREVSFGLPKNTSPRYAPKYDIKNEPVSTLRTTNNVQQARFLGRNAYFSADNTVKEVPNQPHVVNNGIKIGTTKKYNEMIRNKFPFNNDSMIYRNLNNTIRSNYTEKISSLDSFEYKYYRTNDPDQQSDFVIDDKDINNNYGNINDMYNKHDIDKDKIINYALLQKLRNIPRIVVKDTGTSTNEPVNRNDKMSKSVQVSNIEKKKKNKNIKNELFNIRSNSQNMANNIDTNNNNKTTDYDKIKHEISIYTNDRTPNDCSKTIMYKDYVDDDMYKYCNLTKDELFNGFGSLGLAISKIFSLTGKGVLYLCSSISDNTVSLFETEIEDKIRKEVESKLKSAVKNVKINEANCMDHNNNEHCSCNTNKRCTNDCSNLPDLHINYETAISDDVMYHNVNEHQNGGLYVNGNKVGIDRNNRCQRNYKVDVCRNIQGDNYRNEYRCPERQINYKMNNQNGPNEYYDEQYYRNNINKEDYYNDRRPINQQLHYKQPYNDIKQPNIRIDYDTEIEDYDNEYFSKNAFDHEYPKFGNQNRPSQYNNRNINQYNDTFNNQPSNRFNDQMNGRIDHEFNNQYNQQYNDYPYNLPINQYTNHQFDNRNFDRQRGMQMDNRDGRIPIRMDNMRNVNEYTFDSKYNLNRPQYENISSEPTRFNTNPIVQEPGNMINGRINMNNQSMIPGIVAPRLTDLKKEVLLNNVSNGFDKYKTVDVVEKSKRNNLSVSSSGKPNLTAYGSKDGSEMTQDISVHGSAATNISLIPRKEYEKTSIDKNDIGGSNRRIINEEHINSNEVKSVSNKESNEGTRIVRNESRKLMDIKSDMNKMIKEEDDEIIIERISVTSSGTEKTIDRISINESLSSKGEDKTSIGETESKRSDDKSSINEELSDADSKKKNKRRVFPFIRSTKIRKESDNESK